MTLDAFLIAAGEHGLYSIDYDLDDFRQELNTIGLVVARENGKGARDAVEG